MEILVNNIVKDIPPQSKLVSALEQVIDPHIKGIAVAVNNSVVQKAKWNEFILQNGDSIIIIKATQGG